MNTTGLRSWEGLYLCANPDERTVSADRIEQREWETFTIEAQPDGRVALRSYWGRYLSALPDGSVLCDPVEIGEYQLWTWIPLAARTVALKSYFDTYLCVEPGGQAVSNRTAIGPWETFTSSRPTHPDPLRGQLRIEHGSFVDDTGSRLVSILHAGDLIGQGLTFGLDQITPILDRAAAVGYNAVRSWTWCNTEGQSSFWNSKPAPRWDLTAENLDQYLAILRAGTDRGLTWHLAPGGLDRLSNQQEDERFDRWASLLDVLGPQCMALGEACNEVASTGDGDDKDPAELIRLIDRIRQRHPGALYSLTSYTGTEDREVLARYTPSWAQHYYVHGYRGGRAHDKIRHIFSLGYDGEAPPVRRYGWQGEPFGPGDLVSAQANTHELSAGVMQLAAAMAATARQAWAFMSSPGVITSSEPFDNMPGFAETPAVLRELPRDLMTFRTLKHSGPNQAGTRIWAAKGDCRCDYARHDDGRIVAIWYGPPEQDPNNLPQERDVTDFNVVSTCEWGRVVTARLV